MPHKFQRVLPYYILVGLPLHQGAQLYFFVKRQQFSFTTHTENMFIVEGVALTGGAGPGQYQDILFQVGTFCCICHVSGLDMTCWDDPIMICSVFSRSLTNILQNQTSSISVLFPSSDPKDTNDKNIKTKSSLTPLQELLRMTRLFKPHLAGFAIRTCLLLTP